MEIDKTFKLGEGAYGSVYKIKNSKLCVKICDLNKSNYLEPYIMKKFQMKNLNNCEHVIMSKDKLYLIQNVAINNLKLFIRNIKEISNFQIKDFTYQIVNSILFLHNNNIIHGDIKGDNLLLFSDGSIKLTDFSLSVKKLHKNYKIKRDFCTSTHRPMECLLKEECDEKIDIWSLGCTLYEVFYKTLLFPYQQEENDKELFIKKCINCLTYWDSEKKEANINFIKHNYVQNYYIPTMKDFNLVIKNCLVLKQSERPSIFKLIEQEYFSELKIEKYSITKSYENKITKDKKLLVIFKIENLVDSININEYEKEEVKNISYSIYLSIFKEIKDKEISEESIFLSIIYISLKLLQIDYKKVGEKEKEFSIFICNFLQFNF